MNENKKKVKNSMFVIKRDGRKEKVNFQKVVKRIERHCKDLKSIQADTSLIAQKIIQGLFDGVKSKQIDDLAVQETCSMSIYHPEYDKLAVRLAVSALHKDTPSTFYESMKILYDDDKGILSKDFMKFVEKNKSVINSKIDDNRDYLFDYFGYSTISRSYLLKNKKVPVERPQHMFMRVACAIHLDDIEAALQTYDLLSNFNIIHATPTLFNAGIKNNQLASCFLIQVKDDSVSGIYDTLKDCALISQLSGGIGVGFSKIRCNGSHIKGTNGFSMGLVPMLQVFNSTARYVNQGAGKRKGSIACFIEPWHGDIFEFLDLRKNNGKEELRARDLFLGIMASDSFFKAVKENADWYLLDPNIAKDLYKKFGKEFEYAYNNYVETGQYVKKVKATDVFLAMIESQIQTGTPYVLAKDAINLKNNQANLGTITQTNLCVEIMEYTSPEEVAVCNLASISLKSCVEKVKGKYVFNYNKLEFLTSIATENLNKIIDINHYPLEEARYSNLKHRPIGIGVQGLADVLMLLKLSWEDEEAYEVNRNIFETIYYSFLKTSCSLAEKNGYYESFPGSPTSKGLLQFDLWNVTPSNRYDWDTLKKKIVEKGLRNSLGIALMPTASTSQILGNVESFKPITSNIYKRGTLAGEFLVLNKYLVDDLISLNLWNDEIRQSIIREEGSVQNIDVIPDDLKKVYKTVWEISQKHIINMAADRGAFVCQSQSMNLYLPDINTAKVSSAIIYAWEKGLKTLSYYTKTQAERTAIKVTVDNSLNKTDIEEQEVIIETKEEMMEGLICSIENQDDCIMCGS